MEDRDSTELAEILWSTSWTYIRSVIDTAREPFVVLDRDLRVVAANSSFLRTFEVADKDTEGKRIYDLGNGQWDIPRLRNLLEDILPEDTFFRNFEVDHKFPDLGRRIMVLNARKIFPDVNEPQTTRPLPPLILLAMEDVTDRRLVAEKLAEYAQKIEGQLDSKTEGLTASEDELAGLQTTIKERDQLLEELRVEITELKKKIPDSSADEVSE